MKIKKKMLAAVTGITVLGWVLPVQAAETAAVVIDHVTEPQEGTLEVSWGLENLPEVTNGKFRILYDSSKMKLTGTELGSPLEGAMTQINDPLTGNKEEGEVVLVFASAADLDLNGVVADMTFETSGAFEEEGAEFSVSVEEMGADGSTVEVRDGHFTVFADKAAEEGQEEESQEEESQEEESQEETAPDADSGSIREEQQKEQEKEERTEPVNTGDAADLLLPIGTGAGAAAALTTILVLKRETERKRNSHGR